MRALVMIVAFLTFILTVSADDYDNDVNPDYDHGMYDEFLSY